MTALFQAQLDDFAQRLRALEDELDDLRRQADADSWARQHIVVEPAPQRVLTSPDLARVQLSLEARDFHRALKQLERTRRHALSTRNVQLLEQVVGLAREIAQSASGGRRARAYQLVYAAEQNIRFVKRMQGASEDVVVAPPRPRQPRRVPKLQASDLLGARALAIAGGCVTLLGILFFFILAVNRGWIGPTGRVALGAIASVAVFGAGLWLRRRFGETHSALAAVAAGIAGGYGTLLAAAALYSLVPDAVALVVAAGIAAVGVVTALRWRSQLVGGLGLLGAMLVPVAAVAQNGLSIVGTTFVAFMLVAAAIVALRERWNELLVAAMLVAAPQIAALVMRPAYHGEAPARIVVLAAVFSLVYLAIGIAHHLRAKSERLDQLTTGPITGAALLAGGSAARLYATPFDRGIALLVIAAAFGVVAAFFFHRVAWRNLSALAAAVAFTVAAIGFSEVFSGQTLAYAWAAEAAALAWLAHRTKEVRFQMWSAAYFALAFAHVLAIDTPPRMLLRPDNDPLHGVAPAAAVAVVAAVFAAYARPRAVRIEGILGYFESWIRAFAAAQAELRATAYWLSGVWGTYALSLLVLSAFADFGWAHVALTAIWSTIGLALLVSGFVRKSVQLAYGGVAWLAATASIVVIHGVVVLEPTPRSVAFLVLGGALLAAAFAVQLMGSATRLSELAAASTLISIGLAWDAIATLLPSDRAQGAVLLGIAVLYAALAALVFQRKEQRDFTTLLWAIASVVAATAAALLVSSTYLVLCWTAGACVLAWLSVRVREPRLIVPAVAGVAAALVHAIAFEAPPVDFFTAKSNPAVGVPALLIVSTGLAVLALESRVQKLQSVAWWGAGVVAVYAVSLSILELLQRVSPRGSLDTNFQRGHTAVSAFWGLLGLALLYVGLTRLRSLRIAGFALFAVALAKIFLWDLPSLSSITRALSFLAVGAVLLLGGFFYQRLSSSRDEPTLTPRTET